ELLYSNSGYEYGSEQDLVVSEALMLEFAESCQTRGPSTAYFNTQQTARDMDLIRELLGMEELNYLGFSYGTELGANYAALFPDRVGKFVLDGAVDPTMDSSTKLLGQIRGFDGALRAYLTACLDTPAYCPFDGDIDSAMARIAGFLQAREVRPLETTIDRELGISAALAGMIVTLYSQDSWIYLSQAFDEAFNGDGTFFVYLADFYNDRDPDGGYISNINEANFAINCADDAVTEAGPDLDQEIREASVVFGRYFAGPDISCTGWPEGIGMQSLDFSVPLANSPIVIGTTGDPATPYQQAVSLAEILDGAKLLTLKGEGHTAYGDNSCIDSLVDAYLEGQDLGEGDLTCF
ncbi:MAG: alpha/beta hydrolase, partial [Actinobacteria bacterium]|nr:alpha/beta hydrolase [Actinomycetota bacterium]